MTTRSCGKGSAEKVERCPLLHADPDIAAGPAAASAQPRLSSRTPLRADRPRRGARAAGPGGSAAAWRNRGAGRGRDGRRRGDHREGRRVGGRPGPLGATNIADLAAFTPNLEIVTTGSTTATFFIRGVGLNDFGANSTASVAVYQDDVPMNSQALQLGALFDTESVNVLRGPQGTGLARNSSAGAIKIYGRKPTGTFNGYLRADHGNYDFQYYEGAVEAPIYEDLLSGRFSFLYQDRNGTMKNRCGNAIPFEARVSSQTQTTLPPFSLCGEQVFGFSKIPTGLPTRVNDRHNWAGRGMLLFEPTLETSFQFNAHGTRRNEFSRLGQSYGTRGTFCLGGNFDNCPLGAAGIYPNGGVINGLLGGTQGNVGYTAPEVLQRLSEMLPCYNYGIPQGRLLAPQGPGEPFEPGHRCPTNLGLLSTPDGQALDTAKQLVRRELSRHLDRRPPDRERHLGRGFQERVPAAVGSRAGHRHRLRPLQAQDRHRPRFLTRDAVPDPHQRPRSPVLPGREAVGRDRGAARQSGALGHRRLGAARRDPRERAGRPRRPVALRCRRAQVRPGPARLRRLRFVRVRFLGRLHAGRRRALQLDQQGYRLPPVPGQPAVGGGLRGPAERERHLGSTDRDAPAHLSLPRGHARLLEVQPRLEARPLQRHGLGEHRHHHREAREDRCVRDRRPRRLVRRDPVRRRVAVLLRLPGLPDLHHAAVRGRPARVRGDQREQRRGLRRRDRRADPTLGRRLCERALRLAGGAVPRLRSAPAGDGQPRRRPGHDQPRAPELGKSAPQFARIQGQLRRRAGDPDLALGLPDPALRRCVDRHHLLRRDQGPRHPEHPERPVPAPGDDRDARILAAQRADRLPHTRRPLRDGVLGPQPLEHGLQDVCLRRQHVPEYQYLLRR
ncbi:MAG: hypothetical protein E6J87_19130 [Deltaproteobacteria bacterium]|nr:MAG: hypothetical protein E6J87_19130 [Deltaproteobacteria bacterium]